MTHRECLAVNNDMLFIHFLTWFFSYFISKHKQNGLVGKNAYKKDFLDNLRVRQSTFKFCLLHTFVCDNRLKFCRPFSGGLGLELTGQNSLISGDLVRGK